MYFVDKEMVVKYMEQDCVMKILCDDAYGCISSSQSSLLESPAKRFITSDLYGEFLIALESNQELCILDVGGGLSSVSRALYSFNNYKLLDLLYEEEEPYMCSTWWRCQDWATFKTRTYDVVIANDLFPNVDQRLDKFLDKYLSICRELRMSLTVYDDKYYIAKRLDGEEVLTVKAWTSSDLERVLRNYSDYIVDADFSVFAHIPESVFSNGRHVMLITFKGDLCV